MGKVPQASLQEIEQLRKKIEELEQTESAIKKERDEGMTAMKTLETDFKLKMEEKAKENDTLRRQCE